MLSSALIIALRLGLAAAACDNAVMAAPTPEAEAVKIPQTEAELRVLQEKVAIEKKKLMPRPESDRVGQHALSSLVPVYPNVLGPPVPLGDQMLAHGMPMNIQAYETHDDPHKVLDYYKGIFENWHLPMLGNGDLLQRMPYPSITAFDDFNGVDISVIAIPDGASQITLIIAAMSDIKSYEKNKGKAEALKYGGLPPYPGGVSPSALSSTDGDRRTMTVLFKTGDPLDHVVGFYNQQMAHSGFQAKIQPGSDAASYQAIDYASTSETWHFMASADPSGQGTSVMATWQSGPQPKEELEP